MIGKVLAHYQVTEKLGQGGMGVVYKARDMHLDRFVAVKVLPPEKVADSERKLRFIQEAKAASALNHPNIIHIYDINQVDGTDFIAMEYVEGKTLDQRIGRLGLALDDALKYAAQIAGALAKAHSAGIVHRDLKPTNLMVNEDGVVKVLDFGLAKLTEQLHGERSAWTVTADAVGRPITEKGFIVGTLSYMSPEQARGLTVDARTDIWSLGCVLYEMLAGRAPFAEETPTDVLVALLQKEPPQLKQSASGQIPAELEWIILKALRKNPDERYQTSRDLLVDLERLRQKLQIESHLERSEPSSTNIDSAATGSVEISSGKHTSPFRRIVSAGKMPPGDPNAGVDDELRIVVNMMNSMCFIEGGTSGNEPLREGGRQNHSGAPHDRR